MYNGNLYVVAILFLAEYTQHGYNNITNNS